MLRIIKQKSPIPVFVMIRPRGGDFLYTEEEFEVMKEDINVLKEAGADGFVFGILTRFVSVYCVFLSRLLWYKFLFPCVQTLVMTPISFYSFMWSSLPSLQVQRS